MEKNYKKGLSNVFGADIDSMLDDISRNEANNGNSTIIKIDEIRTNPYQPRQTFDESTLKELSDSIKQYGVFNPILVRKAIQGYELVAGERRFRAAKLAGLKDIPCIVQEFDDQDMMEIALLENIQREDLNPVEEAKAYEQLLNKLNYTQDELATRISKSRSHITNTLRILKLPKQVQDMLVKGDITYGHARALVNVEDKVLTIDLARRCKDENLTVRDIERIVAQQKKGTRYVPKKGNPFLDDVRRQMMNKLGTNVQIDDHKIVIKFNNTEDLNGILEKLGIIGK